MVYLCCSNWQIREIILDCCSLIINIQLLCAGEWVSCSVGANFTPHIITVNAGEVSVINNLWHDFVPVA